MTNNLKKWIKAAPVTALTLSLMASRALAESNTTGTTDTPSVLKTVNPNSLITELSQGLTYVLGFVSLILIFQAVKHGIAISHETDARARSERMKGLGGWVIGAIVSFGSTIFTSAVWYWTSTTLK